MAQLQPERWFSTVGQVAQNSPQYSLITSDAKKQLPPSVHQWHREILPACPALNIAFSASHWQGAIQLYCNSTLFLKISPPCSSALLPPACALPIIDQPFISSHSPDLDQFFWALTPSFCTITITPSPPTLRHWLHSEIPDENIVNFLKFSPLQDMPSWSGVARNVDFPAFLPCFPCRNAGFLIE